MRPTSRCADEGVPEIATSETSRIGHLLAWAPGVDENGTLDHCRVLVGAGDRAATHVDALDRVRVEGGPFGSDVDAGCTRIGNGEPTDGHIPPADYRDAAAPSSARHRHVSYLNIATRGAVSHWRNNCHGIIARLVGSDVVDDTVIGFRR